MIGVRASADERLLKYRNVDRAARQFPYDAAAVDQQYTIRQATDKIEILLNQNDRSRQRWRRSAIRPIIACTIDGWISSVGSSSSNARKRASPVTQGVTLSAVEVVRLAGVLSSGNVTPGEAAFAGHVMLRLVRMLPGNVTVPVE